MWRRRIVTIADLMVTVAVLPVEVVVLTHVTAVVIFLVMVQWNESMGDVRRGIHRLGRVSGIRTTYDYLSHFVPAEA